MDEKMLDQLREIGVDVTGTLRRFSGNDMLYKRFLLKFPEDENFGKIGPAFEAGDLDGVLVAAHTLKGVSGNLGMDRLYKACSETVTLLRAGDRAGAQAAYDELRQAHEEVCKVLSAEVG